MTPEEKRAKNKQWYESCKKDGRCVTCGKYDVEPGYIKCADCRKKEREQRQKRNEKRKAANLCVKCGKNPPIESQTCCRECQDKANQRGLELYYWRKKHHICSQCGKEEAAKGKVLCLTCLSDKMIYNISHKKTPEQNKRNLERGKELREERIVRGECPMCGHKKLPGDTHYLCHICRERQNRGDRERRLSNGGIPNTLRGNGMFCAVCRKPVEIPGSKCCNRCLENNRKNIKKAKAASPKDNWFKQVNDYEWRCRIERSEQRKVDKIKRALS